MSYLFPKGPNARYKIYKVSVSTPEDKVLQNTSDFNYEVELPYAITDVVGMSLVEWTRKTLYILYLALGPLGNK